MEENKYSRGSAVRYVLLFLVGLAGSLWVGWWLFPTLLYSEQVQPFAYNHAKHAEMSGEPCETCHFYRGDGTYAGRPTLETCAQCHEAVIGETESEKEFVEKFVEPGIEPEWVAWQKQPDNVYFSHQPHKDKFECVECHPSVEELDKMEPVKVNRLTGYTLFTEQNMKMWQCEECHAEHHASNACYICHK